MEGADRHRQLPAVHPTPLLPPALRRRGSHMTDEENATVSAQALVSLDSFKCRRTITVDGKPYTYFSLPEAEKNGLSGISNLPFSMKVILENLLRYEDDRSVKKADIEAAVGWLDQ